MALKPKQKQLIEAIIAYPNATYVELANIVGINRNTITQWKRQEEFQTALDKRLKEIWKDSESLAINSMINLAKDKNFQASKYILDSLGYAPAHKIEADVNSEINIVIE